MSADYVLAVGACDTFDRLKEVQSHRIDGYSTEIPSSVDQRKVCLGMKS